MIYTLHLTSFYTGYIQREAIKSCHFVQCWASCRFLLCVSCKYGNSIGVSRFWSSSGMSYETTTTTTTQSFVFKIWFKDSMVLHFSFWYFFNKWHFSINDDNLENKNFEWTSTASFVNLVLLFIVSVLLISVMFGLRSNLKHRFRMNACTFILWNNILLIPLHTFVLADHLVPLAETVLFTPGGLKKHT